MSQKLIYCSICLSDIENKCRSNGCGHEFCLQCLLQWTQTRIDCPVCRQTFTSIRHNFQSEDKCFDTISIKQIKAMIQLRDRLTENERRIEYFRQCLTEMEERRQRINEGIERICYINDKNENQVNEIIGNIMSDFNSLIPTDSSSDSGILTLDSYDNNSYSDLMSHYSDSTTDSDTTVDSFAQIFENQNTIIIEEESEQLESSLSDNSDENDSQIDFTSDVINVLQSEKQKECIQLIETHLESCIKSQSITSDMISESDDNFIAENNTIVGGNEDNISSDGSSFSSETSTLHSEVLRSVDSYEINSSKTELLDRMRTNNSEMLSSDDSSSH